MEKAGESTVDSGSDVLMKILLVEQNILMTEKYFGEIIGKVVGLTHPFIYPDKVII